MAARRAAVPTAPPTGARSRPVVTDPAPKAPVPPDPRRQPQPDPRAASQSELSPSARARRADRRPRRDGRLLLPRGGLEGAGVRLHDPPGRARLQQPARLVVDPVSRVERAPRRPFDPVPARDVGPQARRGLQGLGAGPADRAPGHRDRVVRDAQPWRRARPGGAVDRDRQRSGRARGSPGQARRAGDGERRPRGDR